MRVAGDATQPNQQPKATDRRQQRRRHPNRVQQRSAAQQSAAQHSPAGSREAAARKKSNTGQCLEHSAACAQQVVWE